MIEINRFEDITQIRMSRTENGTPMYWVSAYLVDGLLIDTGCPGTTEELVEFLETQKLDLVVNTHHHEDHIGANRLIRERLGVDIVAHERAVPMITQPPIPPPYRERVWGIPEPSKVTRVPERIRTDRFTFEVIETPGHCPGHITLVEPDRGWCFSGDLYLGEEITICGPENNVSDLLESMKKLLDVETKRLVLLTSLRTIEPEGKQALRASVEHLEELSGKAKDLHDRGLSVEAIVDELLGGESVFHRVTNGQYSSANLVRLLL